MTPHWRRLRLVRHGGSEWRYRLARLGLESVRGEERCPRVGLALYVVKCFS